MSENTPNVQDFQKPKLLDRLRAKCRLLHYSIRTEEAYVGWCTKFILFHDKRHPNEMGGPEIERYLTYLATERKVAASTQNQAFSAILFLYQRVLEIELPKIDCLRATRPDRLPVVLSVEEVREIFDRMRGVHRLLAELMYGTGLRILECCRLRVKDLDFDRHQILVRDGKGEKDRVVPLPIRIAEKLREQIAGVRVRQEGELPHVPAQLRHALAGSGVRHPHGAGTAGSCRCEYDDDLHARVATRSLWRRQSAGSIVIFCAHPHEFAKSQSSGRFDVSRLLRRARSDAKVSGSVDFMSGPVDFMSWSVDFVLRPVDFWSVLSPSANRTNLGVTHDPSVSYGKIPRNGSAICDQKVAFWDAKMAKKRFFRVGNCDLRRL